MAERVGRPENHPEAVVRVSNISSTRSYPVVGVMRYRLGAVVADGFGGIFVSE